MSIAQRKGFSRLLEKMEAGDVLVVTKLDRLGRDSGGGKQTRAWRAAEDRARRAGNGVWSFTGVEDPATYRWQK